MFKKGDRIIVKQWGGSYRPATFLSYKKGTDEQVANIRYPSREWIISVPIHDVVSEEVYLSPLWEAMKEEE